MRLHRHGRSALRTIRSVRVLTHIKKLDDCCGRLPLDVEPESEDDELFIPRGLKSGRQPGAKFLREPLDVAQVDHAPANKRASRVRFVLDPPEGNCHDPTLAAPVSGRSTKRSSPMTG